MAKTYIDGTGCKSVAGQHGEFYNMSFNIEKLQQYVNEKGYVNITMSKRREVGQYGDTHYFTLNEWSPDSDNKPSSPSSVNNGDDDLDISSIPF